MASRSGDAPEQVEGLRREDDETDHLQVIADLEEKVNCLTHRELMLTTEKEDLAVENESLARKLVEVEGSLQQLSHVSKEEKSKLTAFETDLARAKEELSDRKAGMEALESELHEANQTVKDLKNNLLKEQEESNKLLVETDKLVIEKSILNEKVHKTSEELKIKGLEIANVKASEIDHKVTISDLEDKLSSLTHGQIVMAVEKEDLVIERQVLCANLQKAEKSIQELKLLISGYEKSKDDFTVLESRLNEAESVIKALENNLRDEQKAAAEVSGTLDKLSAEKSMLEEKLKNSLQTSEDQATLRDKIDHMETNEVKQMLLFADLEERMNCLTHRHMILTTEKEDLKVDNENLASKLMEAKNSLQELDIKEEKSKASALEADLAKAQGELLDHKTSMEALESELIKANKKIKDLESNLMKEQEQSGKLLLAQEEFAMEKSIFQKDANSREEKLEMLRDELETMQASDDKSVLIISELEEKLNSLTHQVLMLTTEKEDLIQDHEAMHLQRKNLEEEVHNLNAAIEQKRQECASCQIQIKELSAEATEANNAKKTISSLRDAVKLLESQNEAIQQSCNDQNIAVDELQAKYSALLADHESTSKLNQALKEERDQRAADATTAETEFKEKISKLEEDVRSLRDEREALVQSRDAAVEKTKSEVENLSEQLERACKEKSELREELEAVKQSGTKETRILGEKIESMKQKETQLLEKLTLLEEALDKSKSELKSREETVSAVTKDLAEVEQKLADARSDSNTRIAEAHKEASEVKLALENAENAVKKYRSKLTNLEEELEESRRASNDQRQETDSLLASKDKELKEFSSRLDSLRKELSENKEDASALKASKKSLEEKLERVIAERDELSTLKTNFDSSRDRLLGTMRQIEREVESLRKENDGIRDERDVLKAALSTKDKQLAEAKSKVAELSSLQAELRALKDDSQPPSWESDEDLRGMSPSDILEVMGDELNLRERAMLNGLVVKQLQEELEKKSDALLNKMIEANKKQQEVDRLQMKIRCLQPSVSPTASKENAASKQSPSPKATDATKKRLLSPQKPLSPSVRNKEDKRTRISNSPMKTVVAPTAVTKTVSAAKVTAAAPAKRMTRQSVSATKLASAAPENPFKKKSSVETHKEQKKPLGTITNKQGPEVGSRRGTRRT